MLNIAQSFLLVLSGSEQFRQSSSQTQNFESLEIVELFSSGLSDVRGSQGALIEVLLDILLGESFSELSVSDSSADWQHLLGELKSGDRDDLSLDTFSINQNSLVIDDVDDGGQLSFKRAVINSSDSADLDKSVVSLCKMSRYHLFG